jgi:hypothetical protein
MTTVVNARSGLENVNKQTNKQTNKQYMYACICTHEQMYMVIPIVFQLRLCRHVILSQTIKCVQGTTSSASVFVNEKSLEEKQLYNIDEHGDQDQGKKRPSNGYPSTPGLFARPLKRSKSI